MKPTIGRIVIYHTTEQERQEMRGPTCNSQQHLPALVVAVWPTTISIRVFSDGRPTTDLWKTSINEGTEEGQWSWPVIQ